MTRQESEEQPKGRMLFTDFDASHMGRPSAIAVETPTPAASVLPSLEEVVSRIDIAFEDDDESPPGDGGFDPASLLRGRARASRPRRAEDGRGDGGGEAAAGRDGDEYADADGLAGDRDDADAHDRPWTAAGDEAGASVFPDPFGAGWLDDLDFGLEGDPEDVDILALVPPVPEAAAAPAKKRGRKRTARKPPEKPYAGVERVKDWFQPPGDADNGGPPGRPEAVGDWYEPPEDADADARSADDLFSDVDLSGAWRGKTGRKNEEPKAVELREDAEDLFADLIGIVPAAPGAGRAKWEKDDRELLGSGAATILVPSRELRELVEVGLDREGGEGAREATADVPPGAADKRTAPENAEHSETEEIPEKPEPSADRGDATTVFGFLDRDAERSGSGGAEPEAAGDRYGAEAEAEDPDPGIDTVMLDPEPEIDDYLPAEPDGPLAGVAPPVLSDGDLVGDSGPPPARDGSGAREAPPAMADGGADDEGGGEEQGRAVDPLDVFANLDADDFDDGGLDDDMQAMLAEDAGAALAEGTRDGAARDGSGGEAPPGGARGVLRKAARPFARAAAKASPARLAHRFLAAAAFRENWRFYCDLIAAVIATGSLAVIASYLLWYR